MNSPVFDLGKLHERVRKQLTTRYFVDIATTSSTTLLAGSGRSGTTWISNVINYANDHRIIFEPFNPKEVVGAQGLRYRQYLRESECDTYRTKLIERIIRGEVRDSWTDQYNSRFLARKRLIKDIRANLLLKWISTHLQDVKLILLLRHPCAVANSKISLGWPTHLEEFLSQPDLVSDYLAPYEEQIRSAETEFERHIFQWCIENYIPLMQLGPRDIHIATYESFCLEPEEELERLFAYLGRDFGPEVHSALERPSQQTRAQSAIAVGKNLTQAWREHITHDQLTTTDRILEMFGLGTIYSSWSISGAVAGPGIPAVEI